MSALLRVSLSNIFLYAMTSVSTAFTSITCNCLCPSTHPGISNLLPFRFHLGAASILNSPFASGDSLDLHNCDTLVNMHNIHMKT